MIVPPATGVAGRVGTDERSTGADQLHRLGGPAGAPGGEVAAEQEPGSRRNPAELEAHALVVADCPVLDDAPVGDPLEVGLPSAEGLAGRRERPLDGRFGVQTTKSPVWRPESVP